MEQSRVINRPTSTDVEASSTDVPVAITKKYKKRRPHKCGHGERCCLTPHSSHRPMRRAVHMFATEGTTGINLSFSEFASDNNERAVDGSDSSSTSQVREVSMNTTQDDDHQRKIMQSPLTSSKKVVRFEEEVSVLCEEHDDCECIVPLCADPQPSISKVDQFQRKPLTPSLLQSPSEQQPLASSTPQHPRRKKSPMQPMLRELPSRSPEYSVLTKHSHSENARSSTNLFHRKSCELRDRSSCITGCIHGSDACRCCKCADDITFTPTTRCKEVSRGYRAPGIVTNILATIVMIILTFIVVLMFS